MGGKQKRAAKYKRWSAAHNPQSQSDNKEVPENSPENLQAHDGSGDHSSDYQPIPYEVQREIIKRRQKKSKRPDKQNQWWTKCRIGRYLKSIDSCMSWPTTIGLALVLYVLVFFLLRFIIQSFVLQHADINRSALYSGVRHAVPNPIYKFIRMLDYMFCSRELSFRGLYDIIFPPEENLHQGDRYRFGDA
ncbi:putative lysosomal cobalamin transporter [Orchesella cincta]|uniref:Putative lysosomal cobalamin transporter n=1 Tax=Orchesella cincta TaxID=48709 RepID=A0A1D2MRZ3_ORCCI|nr:putative lysosomal cobalamin transporter [Orchesella cincta]